ncbi:MAG: TrkH family potassium uptake protein [Deltaproteobacteria bacterium]|nr:TrkH family potassium uptake protein [Deltaproteobacteria bacterium]
MRFLRIFSVLGKIWIVFSSFLFLPVPFSIYYEENTHFVFIFTGIGISLLGLLLSLFCGRSEEISVKEGLVIVSFGWISISFFGTIPFLVTGCIPSLTDAFFESVSGFTTTGASILKNIEVLPKSVLLWRDLIQWLGGMGVIGIAVAIFPLIGVGGFQLFKAEAPGPTKDKISPRISQTAKLLWGTYILFTLVEIVLIMFGGLSLFDAMCIAFGTMATGGYAPYNQSLGAFNSPYIHYVVIIFMFIASTNFNLHFLALSGKPASYLRSTEFRFFCAIICMATVAIMTIRVLDGKSLDESLFRHSLFQVVSIVSTTGFVTDDYEVWPFNAQAILLVLMFIGGCSGSTGGAIKNVRICVMLKFLIAHIKKFFRPHAIFPVRIDKKVVDESIVSGIIAFILLYLLLFILGVFILTFQDVNIDTAIGAVSATLGNVGPGIGNVGPSENYSHLPSFSKWVLSFLMLTGRLELYTVLVLLVPEFWKD